MRKKVKVLADTTIGPDGRLDYKFEEVELEVWDGQADCPPSVVTATRLTIGPNDRLLVQCDRPRMDGKGLNEMRQQLALWSGLPAGRIAIVFGSGITLAVLGEEEVKLDAVTGQCQ